MRIAPHFKLSEFLSSSDHPELAVKPIELSVEAVVSLCRLTWEVLMPLRERFGPVVIGSGYRSRALNAAVNGAGTSRHLRGCAADFSLSTFPARGAWEIITTGQIKPTWDRISFYGDHFHVDITEDGSPGTGSLYVAKEGGWQKI